jgi:uncharacterized protein YdeI (YjbR/CyaY-like superfamily)
VATELGLLDVRTRQQWRRWLDRHHRSSAGIWLVFHKGHTGVTSLAYHDALDEALSVGWIDSLIKRLDADRYARKFTPRRPTSKWSDVNRRRWAALKAAGRLAAAGLAAAPTENRYAPRPAIPELPDYVAQALRATPAAWRAFQQLTPTHRRRYVGWVHTAKRPATRERRLREMVALLVAGKTLGLR